MLKLAPTPADVILRTRLEQYAGERATLLRTASAMLRADTRVVAAWLFGSLGRGDADELSDIDLFVVVADEDFDALIADRYAFMARIGEPLLILEAPQNWPPAGVYNMAHYPASDGTLQIDWYWVRRSTAAIPSETQVIFDRVGLPRLATPTHFSYQPIPTRSPAEVAMQQINLFWAMLLITAKYIVRVPNEYLLAPPLETLHQVAAFVGVPESSLPSTEPTAASAYERIQFLRQLAAQMVELMPLASTRGVKTPMKIIEPAKRCLDLAEALLPLRLTVPVGDE